MPTQTKAMVNDEDDVLVYIDPSKRAIVTIALLIGFFGIHFYMRAFSMCTSYIMADWDAGQYYSAGKALQTAIMVVATSVSMFLIPKMGIRKIMGGYRFIVRYRNPACAEPSGILDLCNDPGYW